VGEREAKEPGEIAKAATDSAAAMTAVGAGLAIGAVAGGPVGAALGALAGAGLSGPAAAVARMLYGFGARQVARAEAVLDMAASEGGIDKSELLRRLESSPIHEELFVRTIRAAADSSSQRKLLALARALASGSTAGEPETVEWESIFVRAVASLDEPHLAVLERFEWSAERLGLGQEMKILAPALTMTQLQVVLPQFKSVMTSLVSTLQGQGLLAGGQLPGISFGGGQAFDQWELTEFGRQLLERLREIGAPLANGKPAQAI
jgi:hypothetical protein